MFSISQQAPIPGTGLASGYDLAGAPTETPPDHTADHVRNANEWNNEGGMAPPGTTSTVGGGGGVQSVGPVTAGANGLEANGLEERRRTGGGGANGLEDHATNKMNSSPVQKLGVLAPEFKNEDGSAEHAEHFWYEECVKVLS